MTGRVPEAPDREALTAERYRAFLKSIEEPVSWQLPAERAVWDVEEDGEQPPDGSDWFFLVGHPRTGSSVAATLLCGHPEVYCGNEQQVLPLFMAVLGAETFFAPRLWFAARYRKQIAMTPANLRRLMEAWRRCVSDRRLFGDKGEMFYENFGPATARIFPNCRFVHTTRRPLDTLSSYINQGWAAWLEDKADFNANLRDRARLMLLANAHWADRAEILDFEDLTERDRFEAALGRIFLHLRADPRLFDYEGAWPLCRHSGAMSRWRSDARIAAFLDWLRQEDAALHDLLLSGRRTWPSELPVPDGTGGPVLPSARIAALGR